MAGSETPRLNEARKLSQFSFGFNPCVPGQLTWNKHCYDDERAFTSARGEMFPLFGLVYRISFLTFPQLTVSMSHSQHLVEHCVFESVLIESTS